MPELLTIKHADFTLRIDCSKYSSVWAIAMGNIPAENLQCNYQWDEGVERIEFQNKQVEGNSWDAVFFDNTDYPVWVDFDGDDVSEAWVMANRQSVYENFSFHARKHVLSGFLNYGNEIGKASLEMHYVKNGVRKCWRLRYEVLSSKLNYRFHWQAILEDIEREYRMLSLDFLKKTYHGFGTSEKSEQKDLIWWNIFKEKQQELIQNIKLIIERPKQRLRDKKEYRRADQLRRITPRIEREFAEHRSQQEYAYRVDVPQLNRDTLENRFLKHVVKSVAERHEQLANKVLEYKVGVSEPLKAEIEQSCKELKALERNPFFNGIGKFKGFTHESLTLQKATGYNQVYKIWLILNRAYDLNDSLYKLETKDIATLYEIWCFIEVKKVVKELLEERDVAVEIDNRSRIEMNTAFTYELGRGQRSRIIFRQEDVELAELIYNPQSDVDSRKNTGIDNVESRTVSQRPDIVLQLTKKDSQTGLKLTYLFDAKYRLGDKQSGVDTPPEDAINQMHRYRDALFYNEHPNYVGKLLPTDLKREVVGGYILFPGDGKTNEVRMKDFYRSIGEVNIGAFPLRPREVKNRELLKDFVGTLIDGNKDELIGEEKSIPQKGMKYVMPENDLVLVARVHDDEQRQWCFDNKWYNIPLDKIADTPLIEARYLLLCKGKENEVANICKIVKSNYDVWTNDKLKENKYPHEPSSNAYFMLRIHRPSEIDEGLKGKTFLPAKCTKFVWGDPHKPYYFVKLADLLLTRGQN